jgi:thymidylate kinase
LELKEVLKKKKKESRFEFKESSFHQKVSIGFKKLGKKKKVKIFNGDKSKKEIHKNIVDFLNKQRILKKKIPYYYDH